MCWMEHPHFFMQENVWKPVLLLNLYFSKNDFLELNIGAV